MPRGLQDGIAVAGVKHDNRGTQPEATLLLLAAHGGGGRAGAASGADPATTGCDWRLRRLPQSGYRYNRRSDAGTGTLARSRASRASANLPPVGLTSTWTNWRKAWNPRR